MKFWFRRIAAIALLTFAYGITLLVCLILPRSRNRGSIENQTVLAIGTFHNPNWFFAHLVPLSQSGVREIILIADGFVGDVEGVRVVVPPKIMMTLFSRAGAKFLMSFWIAIRERPSLYMGYAIFPAATTALFLGRVFRGGTSFQLTSGSLELDGGGYRAENRILSSLGKPSRFAEKLCHALTRQFDLMVVRGSRADHYLRELGYEGPVATITGSIEIPATTVPVQDRETDLIFVGRFTERKRPERFIELVRILLSDFPNLQACMVGDGPDLEATRALAQSTGLGDAVEFAGLRNDVEELLQHAKIFVLTSRWEGLSIAMMEAMAAGCVPVVNDVGDLADMVSSGSNGFLIPDDNINEAAKAIHGLLSADKLLISMSDAARTRVTARASRKAISQQWNESLSALFDSA